MTLTAVDFFFDVASPYSYLAATQIEGLRERTGARVRFRPFLLGAVFKETGNEMPARVAAKARFLLSDLGMWAARYGVPFRMTPHFPLSSLSAQRALVAAERLFGEEAMERLAHVLFVAAWAEGRNIGSGDELAASIAEAGLDSGRLAAEIGQKDVKDALREATMEAVRRGAFGAPTFFVGETMLWGNDRLPLLEDLLRAKQR